MCCVKSVIKRIAPFFLTFAVGLFIASFFVSVAAPNFQFRRGFNKHREMDRQMQSENQRLRDENDRLRNRLAEMEKRDWVLDSDIEVPPPPIVPKTAPKMNIDVNEIPTLPMKTVPSKSR